MLLEDRFERPVKSQRVDCGLLSEDMNVPGGTAYIPSQSGCKVQLWTRTVIPTELVP